MVKVVWCVDPLAPVVKTVPVILDHQVGWDVVLRTGVKEAFVKVNTEDSEQD